MKRVLLAALIAAILIAVLAFFTNLDWGRVAGTLRALDVPLVLLAFVIYASSFVLRGVRLMVLMPGARSLPHLTSISARHILIAVVLPFRTGEASLPLMLSMEEGRPLAEGVSTLGLMRVLDLLCVAIYLVTGLLLGGATAAGGDAGMTPEQLRTRALVWLGVLAAGLLLLRPVAALLAPLAHSPRKAVSMAGGIFEKLAAVRASRLALAVLVSLATWLCTYAACWLLLRAMSGPDALGDVARLGFAAALVGTTGLHLSAAFPVSPLAGAGTWEAGWVAGYHYFVGFTEADAMTSALVSHVVILSFVVVLGGTSFLLRRRAPGGARWSG